MQKINLIQFLPYFSPHAWWLETVAEELSYFYAKKWYGEVINVVFDVGQDVSPLEKGGRGIFINKQRGYTVYLLPSFDIIPNFPVPKFWKKEFWEVLKEIKNIITPPASLPPQLRGTEGESSNKWIVQTHTRFFLSSLIGWIFAKKYKLKWVHVEHGSDYVKLWSILKSKIAYIYDRIIWKWIFKNADEIVAISEWVQNFVVSLSSSDLIRGSNTSTIKNNIQVIYNWIHFIPWKRVENHDVIKLWFVWRLVPLKWVNLLLEAFKKVSEIYTNIELTIIWDWEERENLEKYVQANNLKNVTFLWQQSREYIANTFLPTVDILVNPSYQEGLPTTVIEWLLSQCVVVASDVWWTKEISKMDDLIIIQKWNWESLNIWLKKAIQTYKLVRWKSKQWVEKKFNWDNNIEEYFNLYKKM